MKEDIKQINHPHFYKNDVKYTFEELMNQSVGGISKHKDIPKMHLWLPPDATEDQVKLVKKMIGGFFLCNTKVFGNFVYTNNWRYDTGRDCKDTG